MTTALFSSTGSFGPGTISVDDVKKVIALACDVDCSPKAWATVVNAIPALSARIVQVINTSYGCLPCKIASVGQAVAHLGFNTLKNLASALVQNASR